MAEDTTPVDASDDDEDLFIGDSELTQEQAIELFRLWRIA